MATGGKLSNLTECSLCLHTYERPRSLPCLQSFCQACLQEHVDENGKPDGTVDCPNCRKVATIPRGGVGEFPLNFHLNQLQEMLENKACLTLDGQVFSTHTPTPRRHLKETGETLVSDKEGSREDQPVMHCTEHSGSSLVIYCRDCEMCVCLKCVTGKHNGHTLSDLEEEAIGRREECSKIVQTLQDQLLLSERQQQEIIEYSAIVCTNEDRIKDAVKKHRDLLVKHIDTLADQVLSTAKDQFASEKKAVELLDERVNNLKPRLTRCISAVLELQKSKNSNTTLEGLKSLDKEIQELTNSKLNFAAAMKKVTLHFDSSSLNSLSSEIHMGKVFEANILPELELIDTVVEKGVYGLAFSCDGKSLAYVGWPRVGVGSYIVVLDTSAITSSYPVSRDKDLVLDVDADSISALPGDRLAVCVRSGKVKVASKKGDIICSIPESEPEGDTMNMTLTTLTDGTLAVCYPIANCIKLFQDDSHGYRLRKVLNHFMCHNVEGNAHVVQFTSPQYIAAYADKGFIVSDPEEGAVSAMLPDGASGEYYRKWSYSGDGGGTHFLPGSVASDSCGHVFVATTGGIVILSQEGQRIRIFTNLAEETLRPLAVHSGYLAVGGCELNIYKYMDIVKLGVNKETDRAL